MAIPKTRRRHDPLAVLSLHLAVVCALTTVTAQAQMTTGGRPAPTTVVAIAIVAFFVLAVFCVLVNQYWRGGSSVDGSEGGQLGSLRKRGRRGLDPAALAALPILPYAEVKKHRAGGGELECAVCLAAFEDGEELRLLPQCFHAFHPDCIDPWLQSHVTCPLCRADLQKPAPVLVAPPRRSSPVAVAVDNEDEERKEEAAELERLRCARRAARCVRRAARMPRSNSTGNSPSPSTAAAEQSTPRGDYERFTVRLPPHVRAELLKSRRLRHSASLVGRLRAQSCEESLACGGGGGDGSGRNSHGAKRRWPFFLARAASSARGGAEEPV